MAGAASVNAGTAAHGYPASAVCRRA